MHSADVVAYTYNADIFCPHCTLDAVRANGPALYVLTEPDTARAITEQLLDHHAVQYGIDRYDEDTFDSGDFPKAVFGPQLEDDEHCGRCCAVIA